MITRHYEGLIERNTICEEYEILNKNTGSFWRMASDTFDDPNWKHGDPMVGTMVFSEEQPIMNQSLITRDPLAEIDTLKSDLRAIKDKLGIS